MTHSTVTVLAGGISHEREVSLRSGRRVSDALTSTGLSVSLIDPDATLLSNLAGHSPSAVWPALHGSSGEDGALLDLLRAGGHRYVGPSPESARLAWHKPTTKTLAGRAGISTAASLTLAREAFRELGASAVLDLIVKRLGEHLVVKPAQGGSAQGVSIVTRAADLPRAMVEAFTYAQEALVETFVAGTEVGVTLLNRGSGVEVLPAVEIVPLDGVYSFEARYNAGETTFYAPARLPAETTERVAASALSVYELLGLDYLARIDLIVDASGEPWLLEANALPGLTETSLVPLAIEAAGYDLAETFAALVARAQAS
jgi:D-alanine-D-alanine ligase